MLQIGIDFGFPKNRIGAAAGLLFKVFDLGSPVFKTRIESFCKKKNIFKAK
jgi:hypothetical protein